ncbi:MAG: hypothetical protein CMP18_02995 [Rickettsiales bacterium]|jgi:hypothetical protein|nr:hypothetical protein [Rickettsiales bacterium]|tara:strand:- start:19870 stop:21537 length:1668 start_codon:yes stop_codon:yes gene_type:complete
MEDKFYFDTKFESFLEGVDNIIADKSPTVSNEDKKFAEFLKSSRILTDKIRNYIKDQDKGAWLDLRKSLSQKEEINLKIDEIKKLEENLSDPYKDVSKNLLLDIENISYGIEIPGNYDSKEKRLDNFDICLAKALYAQGSDNFKEVYEKIITQPDSTIPDRMKYFYQKNSELFNEYLGRYGSKPSDDEFFNKMHGELSDKLEKLIALSIQSQNNSPDFIQGIKSELALLQQDGSDGADKQNLSKFFDDVDKAYIKMSNEVDQLQLRKLEKQSKELLENYSNKVQSNGDMESNLFYLRLFMIFLALATPLGPVQAIFGLVDFINFFDILNNLIGVILPSDAATFGEGVADAVPVPGVSHIAQAAIDNIPILKEATNVVQTIIESGAFELLAVPVEVIGDKLGLILSLLAIFTELGNDAKNLDKKDKDKDEAEVVLKQIIGNIDNLTISSYDKERESSYDKERDKFIELIKKITSELDPDKLKSTYELIQKVDPGENTKSNKELTSDEYKDKIAQYIVKKACQAKGLKPHIPDTSITGAQSKQLSQGKISAPTAQLA